MINNQKNIITIDLKEDMPKGLAKHRGTVKNSVRKIKTSKSDKNLLSLAQNSNEEKTNKLPKIRDYQLIKELGKGTFGKVYLAQKDGEEKTVAIKVLDKFFLSHVI